jgi:hypothetical protein
LTQISAACTNGVFSPDGRLVASSIGSAVCIWSAETGRIILWFVFLDRDQWIVIDAEGHSRQSSTMYTELIYIVDADDAQQVLTPEEFTSRYGWTNDPEKVHLVEPADTVEDALYGVN